MSHGRMPDCYVDVISLISRALHLAQLAHHDDLVSVAEEFRASVRQMGALDDGHAQSQAPVSRNYRVLIDVMKTYADIGDLMEAQLGSGASGDHAARAGPDGHSASASERFPEQSASMTGGRSSP